jgi:2,3-bisphosphoglycerate-dependent phosphoglycerate mutase
MTRIILVRHGQAICNVERAIEGVATCRGLSELGHRQAAAVATRLASESHVVHRAIVSPIRRARETADHIASALGLTFTTDPDFEEVRPGDAEGMTWDQYSAFYGNTEGWNATVAFAPNAEAWVDFAARVSRGLDRLVSDPTGDSNVAASADDSRTGTDSIGTNSDETVLVVAHGGVIDASLFHYFGLDPMVQSPIDFESTNTGITEWERRSFTKLDREQIHRWRLARYNDAGHLLGLQ